MLFLLLLAREELRIQQRALPPKVGLEIVFDKEQLLIRLARLFWSTGYKLFELTAILRGFRESEWKCRVTLKGELRNRQLAARTAGVSGYEQQFPVFGTVRAPVQVVGTASWFAAFICPYEADIEVEAREIEIIRIAAELSDPKLRREHQAHVGVALVAVQIVDPAVVQGYQVATHAWIRAAALLQLRPFGAKGVVRVVAGLAGRRTLNLSRHIANLHQLIEFECGTFALLGNRFCDETAFNQVLFWRRQLIHAIDHAMMICHDQSLGRDE